MSGHTFIPLDGHLNGNPMDDRNTTDFTTPIKNAQTPRPQPAGIEPITPRSHYGRSQEQQAPAQQQRGRFNPCAAMPVVIVPAAGDIDIALNVFGAVASPAARSTSSLIPCSSAAS
jgi:hypothetical protein